MSGRALSIFSRPSSSGFLRPDSRIFVRPICVLTSSTSLAPVTFIGSFFTVCPFGLSILFYRWSKNGVFFESAPSTGFQFEAPDELSPLNKGGYSINNNAYDYKEFMFMDRSYLSKTIWFKN
mgnify:CR=1 FL=1